MVTRLVVIQAVRWETTVVGHELCAHTSQSRGVGMKAKANESGICRFYDNRNPWRVLVQTWPERDGYRGRIVFEQGDAEYRREGPDALRGRTREELIAGAYELPESRLREIFRSLA